MHLAGQVMFYCSAEPEGCHIAYPDLEPALIVIPSSWKASNQYNRIEFYAGARTKHASRALSYFENALEVVGCRGCGCRFLLRASVGASRYVEAVTC